MVPPLVSYITFNRLGLTVKSLSSILQSTDDFEMHIVDSNSSDDTWDYIMSLDDSRIKSKVRNEVNHGKVHALNMNLSKRRPEQFFFRIDNDVYMEPKDWIGRFLRVFEEFPETGLLGARPIDGYLPPVIPQIKNELVYLELSDNVSDGEHNFVPDCCLGLRPELIKEIGYYCEENCFGDRELSYRVMNHTNYKAGFMTDVAIQLLMPSDCDLCTYADRCKLDKGGHTCFTRDGKLNINEEFLQKFKWKFEETMRDMKSGARPVYCASLLDGASINGHIYNMDWALDNFLFFIKNAN